MRKLIFFFIFLWILQGKSQEIQSSLLTTSGDFFINNSYSVSWSLGELTIETFIQSNTVLTQGFQQTKLSSTGIEENPLTENRITIYPNPATDIIFVNYNSNKYNWNMLEVFDLIGSKIILQKIDCSDKKIEIEINNLKPGTYLLHLKSEQNKNSKSLLFQKIK